MKPDTYQIEAPMIAFSRRNFPIVPLATLVSDPDWRDTPLVDIQTTERFLPYEVWHPMLLRRLDALMQSNPERFNVWRIREENPELFREMEAKSDAMRSFCYPSEAEVLTYVAEFASLFLELDEMREPKSVLEENRKP